MTKNERNKARAEGKIIIRAQYTHQRGWKVVKLTEKGGWTPIHKYIFDDPQEAICVCQILSLICPDIYCDDNY